MFPQKFDEVLIEQPGLFDVASVSCAIKNLHFAVGDAVLQSEGGLMNRVFTAADDEGRASYLRIVVVSIGFCKRFE